MIKALWCLQRNPELELAEFSQHWFEVHGRLHLQPGHKLLGYVQHHTLFHAYDNSPFPPTHDGASIVWARGVEDFRAAVASDPFQAAARDGLGGVRGLALVRAPMAFSLATERVILEGETNPLMVKSIYVARRNPDLPADEFYEYWETIHGALGRRVPGLKRYVQNHGLSAAHELGHENAYDGWTELWWNDLDAFYHAMRTEEWSELRIDARSGPGRALFMNEDQCLVIGRERQLLPPPKQVD